MSSFRIVLIFLFFTILSTNAQERYGNEWINFQQKYLKIVVNEDGIYKISGSQLISSGWDLSNINPNNFQIFLRGKQIPIQVSNTIKFSNTDYIEFFGEKNVGTLDSLLYRPLTGRSNPYYSLFSEESNYYLTIGAEAGKRVESIQTQTGNLALETYHLQEEVRVNISDYSYNNLIGLIPPLMQSYYEPGECRTGPYYYADSVTKQYIGFTNRVKNEVHPKVTIRFNGRYTGQHTIFVNFLNDNPSKDIVFGPWGVIDYMQDIKEESIVNENAGFTISNRVKRDYDFYSINFMKVVYPQTLSLGSNTSKYFYLRPNPTNQSLLNINGFNSSGIVYDVSDKSNIKKIYPDAKLNILVQNTSQKRTIFVSNSYKNVLRIENVKFDDLSKTKTNYIIITDSTLLSSANEFVSYRASTIGGSYKPIMAFSRDLYEQFSYGEKNPIAIKRFCDFILNLQSNPADMHLLLLGKCRTFPEELRSNALPNLVPSIGYPGSDLLLTSGLNGRSVDVPGIPTGRLSVTKNEEVLGYLNKIKEFEKTDSTNNYWKKQILHLSGGSDSTEIKYLANILQSIAPKAENNYFNGTVRAMAKKSLDEIEKVDITTYVNNGLSLISYAGHGSATELDYNFGYCSPVQNGYNNKGKYPFMVFDGCGIANVFYKYNPLSTDWLLTPNKGAIAVIANSYWGFGTSTQLYLDNFYGNLFVNQNTIGLTIGQIHQKTLELLNNDAANDYTRAEMHQLILQGDPALKIFPMQYADYAVSDNQIFIQSKNAGQTIGNSDSLNVTVAISNLGVFDNVQKIPVKLSFYNLTNNLIGTQNFTFSNISKTDTLFFTIKKDSTVSKITVMVDNDNTIKEYNKVNNKASLNLPSYNSIINNHSYPNSFYIDKIAPSLFVTIDGRVMKNNDYASKNPVIKIDFSDDNLIYAKGLQLSMANCLTCNLQKIDSTEYKILSQTNQEIVIEYLPQNLAAGTYKLFVTGIDANGNKIQTPYQINFVVTDKSAETKVQIFPNPGQDYIQIKALIVAATAPNYLKVNVFDNIGNLVETFNAQPNVGQNIILINRKNKASGIYNVNIEIQGETVRKSKIVFN